MLKKLDWFIIKNFIKTFLFCVLLLSLIIVVVDLSENLDEFNKFNFGAKEIILQYYVGFMPRIIALLIPLFIFISVILFTSTMANRSEIIAMFSSGVSLKRFLRPYLICSVFLALLAWYANRTLIPKANIIWNKFDSKVRSADNENNTTQAINNSSLSNYYQKIDTNKIFMVRYYDTITKSGDGLVVFTLKNNEIKEIIRGQNFRWDSTTKWRMENVVKRTINEYTESVEKFASQTIDLNLYDYELRKDAYVKDQLSSKILNKYIEGEKRRGSLNVKLLEFEKYNRSAVPFSIIVLSLMAAIIASKKVRGGSGAHIAIGIILSLAYVIFSRFSLVFATKGNLNAILAAWIVNIIFMIILYYLYKKRAT